MEYRFVLLGTESRPEIFKVQLNMTARLVNQYPDRRVAIFKTLKEATMAALALIARAEVQSRSGTLTFATGRASEIAALRRRFSELTEDRIETFIP